MEKMILMTVYGDSTGLLSESEMNNENMVDLMFPERIVRQWYEETNCAEETADELGKDISECTFEEWVEEVYTCDSTDGLYDFAVERGCDPYFPFSKHDAVFYRDDCNFKTIVFEGDYLDCRKFGRDNDWTYTDEEGNEFELEILSSSH